jgi:2-polyprenyl-6-methoxyphenol hydroxylase-like FAD-dependent oxidoreductase
MRVLIIGCGLAGLATALSLSSSSDDDDVYATHAHEITIVEKRSDLESRGATFGLHINGQNALSEIEGGVGAKMTSNILAKLQSEGILMPSGGYMLPWWKVRDALLEEVQAREEKIKIHLGVSIDSITEKDNGSYLATFKGSNMQIVADVIIGADGVNSYVRRDILKLPPAKPSGVYVWRGSIDTNASSSDDLKEMQEYPIGKFMKFGEAMILSCFNFHEKVDGQLAWVFTVRANMLPSDHINIDCGTTTPIDVIKAYMEEVDDGNDDEELKENYKLAMIAFGNTHQPSDLTWSSEMAVVDLNQDDIGWVGKGRITLIGDAAHSIRPANGLGGSLAFEDAALLGRYISRSNTSSSTSIEEQLRAFEKIRLPRCKSISNDQSIRSKLSYTLGYGVPAWDPAYAEWISDGVDATPEPPVSEVDVFADFISDGKDV